MADLSPLAEFRKDAERLMKAITPGEWTRRPYLDAPSVPSLTIVDVEGAEIAAVRGWAGDRNHDEADAAFIAAAPRLLHEALAQIARLEERAESLRIMRFAQRVDPLPVCVCGHNERWHLDLDGGTHECHAPGCACWQFREAEPTP